MATTLSTWHAGDTDYIATHNADNQTIATGIDGLASTKQDASAKGVANGYASLGAGGTVPGTQLPTDIQYTEQKGQINGYCDLDATGKIPIARIPDITVQAVFGGVQNTSQKDQPNGYAGLDSGGHVPVAEIPSLSSTYQVVSAKGAASGYCDLDSSAHVPASRLVAANIPDLSSSYLTAAQRGAASGVAELDSGGKVPTAELPDLSGTYQAVSGKGAANGYASLDAGGLVPTTQIPVIPSGSIPSNVELNTNKNVASGYCPLDSSVHVPAANLVAANIPDLSATYKILAYAEPVQLPAYYPGKPAASALLLAFLPAVATTIDANLASTRCKAGTNPTATATLSVQKNGSEVATIQIATNGAITLSTQAAISLTTSDELTVVAPGTQDATLADVRLCIHGTR